MSMMDAARNGQSRVMAEPAGPGQQPSQDAGKLPMQAVHYRPADNPQQSCGMCKYADGTGGCALVAGVIQPQDTCDLFEAGQPGSMGQTASPAGAPPVQPAPQPRP